ncbi:hypothetical protein [Cupriavidus sp. 2SB]|uniref:hypothetical protein n=1 Tax=Cupriavidus sp. 2SB TaxID=2502199 RepID=UPI0010F63D9E|nr:hypothetical protein [Cupriavidus sp. 2SB]
MVTEEVAEFIPAEDEGVDPVDTTEVDGFDTPTATGKPSELERMSAEFLDNPKRPKTFIDRFIKAMYADERTHKICRVRALKSKVDLGDVDEILQRVVVVFFATKQLDKLREANAIYAVIYAIASNVCREHIRDALALTINHDSIEEMRERGEELENVGLVDSEPIDRDQVIDSRTAAAKMALAFRRHLNGEEKMSNLGVFDLDPLIAPVAPAPESAAADKNLEALPAPAAPKPRVRRANRNETLSADQLELVQICADLQMRNQDFAAALGIGLPRLSSYIYGRTASVPADIMTAARKLRDEEPEAMARREMFNRPMSDILGRWANDLQVESDTDLATILGVTKMTIFRWRTDETKPDNTALNRYEQVVRTFKNRLAAIKQR